MHGQLDVKKWHTVHKGHYSYHILAIKVLHLSKAFAVKEILFEDSHLRTHRCENLKYYLNLAFVEQYPYFSILKYHK
jgi:hypothetical protein